MAAHFDRNEAARRVTDAEQRPIGDAILDQRVVAGLGNIFKSEGLFLAKIDPRRPAFEVQRDELERLWDQISPIMHRGTERYGKTATTPDEMREAGQLHYVYRRLGRPCFVCGTKIEMIRQGELERSTYFCSYCQH
jgi:formamidopyrimidine-DNA glycosylase